MTEQQVTTALPGDVYWRFTLPTSTGSKMLLLNLGGVAVIGNWQGALGEYFQAWCPLPKKPKPLVHNIEAAVDAWVEMERKAWMFDELVRFSKQPGVDAETLAQALLDLHVNIVHPAQTHSTC